MTEKEIEQAALLGSQTLNLKRRDGVEVAVTIRCIMMSETEKFLDCATDEAKALAMTVVEPAGFDPDVLADDDYHRLAEANLALNFTVARARFERRRERAVQTGVGLQSLVSSTASLLQKFAPPSASTVATAAKTSSRSPIAG